MPMGLISNEWPWFDTALNMKRAVNDVCNSVRWKITSLLRTSRVFDTPATVIQFKSRILSFIEHRTAAVYHADSTVLDPLDAQYDRFLKAIGLGRKDSLLNYSLALLTSARYGNAWRHSPSSVGLGAETN